MTRVIIWYETQDTFGDICSKLDKILSNCPFSSNVTIKLEENHNRSKSY